MSDDETQPSLVCEYLYLLHNYLPGQVAFCTHVKTRYNSTSGFVFPLALVVVNFAVYRWFGSQVFRHRS